MWQKSITARYKHSKRLERADAMRREAIDSNNTKKIVKYIFNLFLYNKTLIYNKVINYLMKVLKARLWPFPTIYSHGAKYVVATFPLLCMNLDISGLNTVNNPWVKIKSKVVDMRRGTS